MGRAFQKGLPLQHLLPYEATEIVPSSYGCRENPCYIALKQFRNNTN